ncbi:MAG: hypothetical protein RLZZ292_695, partial [Bacteroidota bacterium]
MTFNLKLLLAVVFCCAVLQGALAQKKELKTKFGKISDEEMAMPSYKSDPEAAAVVLFDKGRVFYTYNDRVGWTQTYERHKRVKIFKKEGYDEANVSFVYNVNAKIEDVKAVTYNLEGGKIVETKLTNDNIVTETLTKARSSKKMTLPAVKEGSIIEYKYSIIRVNAASLPDWYFQDQIPTIWSEFEAEVPEVVSYRKVGLGYTPFLVTESSTKIGTANVMYREDSESNLNNNTSVSNLKITYPMNAMRYVQANVPALKLEAYTNSVLDYLSCILFEVNAIYNVEYHPQGDVYVMTNTTARASQDTWGDLGKEMYSDVYTDWTAQTDYIDATALQSIDKSAGEKDKVSSIYAYFGKNFQTNVNDYVFPSQALKVCSKTHKGTATDLNLLFISYLKEAGLTAYPVMLSTRKHGRVHRFYPNILAFNRAITAVMIDGKETLIDVSNPNLAIGLLPYEDTNEEGLALKSKTDMTWVALENKVTTRTGTFADLTLGKEGGLNGSLSISTSGYDALKQRNTYKEMGETKAIASFLKELASDGKIL